MSRPVSRAPLPAGRVVDLRGGTAAALERVGVLHKHRWMYLLVCVDGEPPVLLPRAAYIGELRKQHEGLAHRLESERPPSGWIATLRLAKNLSATTAVVGRLKVDRP